MNETIRCSKSTISRRMPSAMAWRRLGLSVSRSIIGAASELARALSKSHAPADPRVDGGCVWCEAQGRAGCGGTASRGRAAPGRRAGVAVAGADARDGVVLDVNICVKA